MMNSLNITSLNRLAMVFMLTVLAACNANKNDDPASSQSQTPQASAPQVVDVSEMSVETIAIPTNAAPSRKTKRVQSIRQKHIKAYSGLGAIVIATSASGEATDRSEYPEFVSNGVKLAVDEPVSTFSIDVDTSSYSVMRSYLNRGDLPPAFAIRTEELLNYFSYDYQRPDSAKQPFQPQINVFESPWSDSKQLIHIGIKGYDIEYATQPKSNIVFLLDVSGSMNQESKLPLVKKSMGLLLKSLLPDDTVSIVVYAGASGVVLEPTKVSNRAKILSALEQLSAGGGTAGAQGLELAYAMAEENFDKDAVNRIFLATDGDFNVGASSNQALQKLVEEKRDKGIYLSVLGFGGHNYQDDMMQAIAQYGNGVAAYIDSLQEAKKVLIDEAASNLFPIANDVKIQVEFNPENVAEYRLLGYETRALAREDFNNDNVDAGEIGAGHSVTAIYEVTLVGASQRSVDALRYQAKSEQAQTKDLARSFNNELGFVKIRYKLPGEQTSKVIEMPIDKKTGSDSEALFAAAVVSFSEILRGGKYQNGFEIEDVISLAKANKGQDEYGYRGEFIQLVELAKHLQ